MSKYKLCFGNVVYSLILSDVEDEHYSSTFLFKKFKLQNGLTIHLDLVAWRTFVCNLDSFPFGIVMKGWIDNRVKYTMSTISNLTYYTNSSWHKFLGISIELVSCMASSYLQWHENFKLYKHFNLVLDVCAPCL